MTVINFKNKKLNISNYGNFLLNFFLLLLLLSSSVIFSSLNCTYAQLDSNLVNTKSLFEFFNNENSTQIEYENKNINKTISDTSNQNISGYEKQQANNLAKNGLYLLKNGNPIEAIEYLTESKQIDPNNKTTDHLRSLALENLSSYSTDMKVFEELVELKPNSSMMHYKKGVLFTNIPSGLFIALREFDIAISLQPNFTDAISEKAFVLSKMGNYNESLQFIDKALSLDQKNYHLYHLKANILESFLNSTLYLDHLNQTSDLSEQQKN